MSGEATALFAIWLTLYVGLTAIFWKLSGIKDHLASILNALTEEESDED